MIERYSRPKMAALFSDQRVMEIWIQVERAIAATQVEDKVIPSAVGKKMLAKLDQILEQKTYSLSRMRELEQKTKHETLAFVEMISDLLGEESAYIHLGVTSSDILDTTLMIQIREALTQLLDQVEAISKVLLRRAKEDQKLVTIGRTHGMFAEPTSFGLKWLSWYSESKRNHERLARALQEASFGKISGAVGNNTFFSVKQETAALKKLGLHREPVSTQVVPRDRIASVLSELALVGVWIERVCTEIRHLQRSEVGEVQEGFAKTQKGSSAMPHKKNPIGCENLVGCARLLRTNAFAALENCALWHERDMSHSSVERVIVPDSFILIDYMLDRFQGILENLIVIPKQVKANREKAGEIALSGKLLTALSRQGCPRTMAYELVQRVAFSAREEGISIRDSYLEEVKKNPEFKKYPVQWDALLKDETHLSEVKNIYESANKL